MDPALASLVGTVAVLGGAMAWLLRYLFTTYLPNQTTIFDRNLAAERKRSDEQAEADRALNRNMVCELQRIADGVEANQRAIESMLNVTSQCAHHMVQPPKLYKTIPNP